METHSLCLYSKPEPPSTWVRGRGLHHQPDVETNSLRLYPKQELLATWARDREALYQPDAENPPRCLRCGAPLRPRLVENAPSCSLDVYICPSCGTDEAMRDLCGNVLPLREWYAVKNNLLVDVDEKHSSILVPECSFKHMFSEPQEMIPLGGGIMKKDRSKFQLGFSRLAFCNYIWWPKLFSCKDKYSRDELALEMDTFQKDLIKLPEFHTLMSMQKMCPLYAEKTTSQTAFHLYTETKHFYIWLRLFTREDNYNIWTQLYEKVEQE